MLSAFATDTALILAIALIVDMDTPFAGLIVVSPEPMQAALAQINSPQEESRACGANVSFPAIE